MEFVIFKGDAVQAWALQSRIAQVLQSKPKEERWSEPTLYRLANGKALLCCETCRQNFGPALSAKEEIQRVEAICRLAFEALS